MDLQALILFMSLIQIGMFWPKPLTVDSKLLSTVWISCQLPTRHAYRKEAFPELERGVLAFLWCLMFHLHMDISQERSRASFPG